jgi:hypothetical protein
MILVNSLQTYFKPAVDQNSCTIDQKLLDERTQKTARTALISLAAVFALVLITSPISHTWVFSLLLTAMPLTLVPMFVLPAIHSAIAERSANIKAVDEYLAVPPPSVAATMRIQSNIRAAELLVDKKGYVNRENVVKARPISYLVTNECNFPGRFQVFKYLIEHGAFITPQEVECAVCNSNSCFLEHLIKIGKVTKAKYIGNQFNYWTTIGSPKTGLLLKELGFDPNVTNNQHETPLMVALKSGEKERAAALVKCGARPLSAN